MGQNLYAALGISRSRFAELLYEHEGFVDHKHGECAPDRDVPVWIDSELTEPVNHHGDCTGQPYSCMVCHAVIALEQADELMRMIQRALSPTTTTEQGDG